MRAAWLAALLVGGCYQDVDLSNSGPLDGGSMDGGDGGRAELCADVDEATLCLGRVPGFPGTEVSVEVRLGLPVGCEGVAIASGSLRFDSRALELLNPTSEGCVRRVVDGDLVVWTRSERFSGCPPLFAGGAQDVLRFGVSEEAPAETLPLAWDSVVILAADLPASCGGQAGVDGAVLVR